MKAYLKALRAPFLAGSIVPVIIGAAFAFTTEAFSLLTLLMSALGVAGLHLGANLLNDYYDARGSDPINVRLTPFSGGSRVIQNKEIAPWVIMFMSIIFFALGLGVGMWFVYMGRPYVIIIGLLGLLCGWAYSSPPLQLMSRGWGEVVIFFAFGPLITLGSHYVMAGSLSLKAFALGFPQGFLIAGVIWINQFPDYIADKEAGKKNLVVRLGPNISRYLYCLIMTLAFLVIILLVFVGLPHLTLVAILSFPLVFKAMRIAWREYLSHTGIIPAQALTIQTVIAQGLLLSLGLFLSRLIDV
jgi:1,4-dihydroxy-2-naphthoate octaprenyltransferase